VGDIIKKDLLDTTSTHKHPRQKLHPRTRKHPSSNHTQFTMKISSTFTLLLSVASVATALPKGKKHHAKHSFKVHRVEGNKYVRSHSNAITKSYQKWGMALPEEFLQNTLDIGNTKVDASGNITTPGQVGSVENTPTQYDVEFLSPVTIGGQTLMMDFDTGSSDL
jgi:hypothetical protein